MLEALPKLGELSTWRSIRRHIRELGKRECFPRLERIRETNREAPCGQDVMNG